MSKFFQDDDGKAIAIPRLFSAELKTQIFQQE